MTVCACAQFETAKEDADDNDPKHVKAKKKIHIYKKKLKKIHIYADDNDPKHV